MKVRVGVEGLTFDAANYTPGSTEKCRRLHGHTFRVDVEVEGDINPDDGMVMDFLVIKRVVREVIEDYDHKVILPKRDKSATRIEGRFDVEIHYIDKPFATTEYLALDMAEKLLSRLRARKVKVKLYEGSGKYALVEIEGDEIR